MIYSCTLFYNEFNLFNVKVQEELAGGVDRVIVVEATRTHQNEEKPLKLQSALLGANNPLASKVECLFVGKEFDKVTNPNLRIAALQREAIQRNAAVEGLDLKDDDVVIASDVDEIFNRDEIQDIAAAALRFGFIKLVQKNFHFKINLYAPTPWYCPFAVSGKLLRMSQALKSGLTLNRLRTKEGFKAMTNGKHFSFIMTPEQIADKFKAYSHVEYNDPKYLDVDAIRTAVNEGRDICERDRMRHLFSVQVDDTWPLAMREELDTTWLPFMAAPAYNISDIPAPEVPLVPLPDVEVDFYKEVNDLP